MTPYLPGNAGRLKHSMKELITLTIKLDWALRLYSLANESVPVARFRLRKLPGL